MKKNKLSMNNNNGYVLIAATMVMVGITAMGLVMVRSAGRSRISAENLKNKARAFYASDGVMTLLVQEVINDNAMTYLGHDDSIVIETENFEVREEIDGYSWNVVDLTGASGGKAVKAGPDSPEDYIVHSNFANTSPRLDYPLCLADTGTHYVWTRATAPQTTDDSYHMGINGQELSSLKRINIDIGTWTWSCMTMDSVSVFFNIDEPGIFTLNVWMRENGLIIDKILITTHEDYAPSGVGPEENACNVKSEWQVDNFTVTSSLAPRGLMGFDIKTDAFMLDNEGNKIYSAPLQQYFSKGGSLGYPPVEYIDIFYYDWHTNCDSHWRTLLCDTCPYHNDWRDNRDWTCNPAYPDLESYNPAVKNSGGPHDGTMYVVNNALTADRKPVLVDPLPGNYRDIMYKELDNWFRVSGTNGPDPAVEFYYDSTRKRWQWGLVGSHDPLPNYSSIYGGADREGEYVGPNHDPDYCMANVLIVDSLEFHLIDNEKGTYWFQPNWSDIEKGFLNINDRGFGQECGNTDNVHFASEMHNTFIYRGGEIFAMTGGDDLWVFIDDTLVINKGGIHGAEHGNLDTVYLDDLAAARGWAVGDEITFDFFQTEKQPPMGQFWGSTNINMSPRMVAGRRRWKRDYGVLD
ncbi:MAG: fibro-slime domain-containing protein [Chitinivibrionales bacterium]|nr:fibro-slime domain-containing protein [Chitinivibrionales bacterium]